jgi:tetratricopeptide (TPR) repeat protein
MLAGDSRAAERELRRGLEAAERAGLTGSYFAHGLYDELAQALCAQGRFEEAGDLVELSEQVAAEDDVQAQVAWRAVRAKVLAHRGDIDAALPLARAAVTLAERTELILVHAQALLDLAEVLRLAALPAEAGAAVERALRLYEQKGDLVSAERTRVTLAELAVAI